MAGVRGEKLLTASDLAALCEVDLKTIHNWVDRGRIAHFRTPGRHLRFRAADVAEFLRAWGYSVPRELARASARTVLVVGSKDTLAHVNRTLGDTTPVRDVKHPYDALVLAGSDPADVFILDTKAVSGDVDVTHLIEALHRACPQSRFVALSDEPMAAMPPFVTKLGRADVQALRTLIVPEQPAPAAAPAAVEGGAPAPLGVVEEPPKAAGGVR
jgi:excisionase family DNA binding protein